MSAAEIPYHVPEELNDPSGDIILRSSDQVEFRASRWPLQRLSPVLSDMFHLPDPPTLAEPSAPPVVQMDETAPVIEALLRLCYPIDPPIVKDTRTIALIIEAIVKLQAERRCRWWIRMTTENLVTVNPWAMYAILLASGRKSCDYNFEEEIRMAARKTVGRQVVRPWAEASMISAADYDRLLIYHSDCKNIFLGAEEEVWNKAGIRWLWFNSQHCPPGATIRVGKQNHVTFLWFSGFYAKAKEVFCKELRGEAIEAVSLWYDLLDRDVGAKTVCHTCAKTFATQMPVYVKTLSRLMEEAVSQVTTAF